MDAGAALVAGMFAAGLASGVHCVAMCGGIVTAFDAVHARRVIPIQPHGAPRSSTGRRLAFNAGRICTYAAAGAVAGALGVPAYAAAAIPLQEVLKFAVSLLLLAIGLNLAFPALLANVERLGLPLWRRVQPLAIGLLRAPTLPHAFAGGLAWGLVPCAMVYAALASATAAGSAPQGALAMAAFGAGTLPFLLAAGWFAARIASWRRLAGGLLIAFGCYGLAHAAGAAEAVQRGLLCISALR